MLTVAFGKSTMIRTQVQLWYKEGPEDVNDNARRGRPSTLTTEENIEAVKQKILDNPRVTPSSRNLKNNGYFLITPRTSNRIVFGFPFMF